MTQSISWSQTRRVTLRRKYEEDRAHRLFAGHQVTDRSRKATVNADASVM